MEIKNINIETELCCKLSDIIYSDNLYVVNSMGIIFTRNYYIKNNNIEALIGYFTPDVIKTYYNPNDNEAFTNNNHTTINFYKYRLISNNWEKLYSEKIIYIGALDKNDVLTRCKDKIESIIKLNNNIEKISINKHIYTKKIPINKCAIKKNGIHKQNKFIKSQKIKIY